MQPEEPAHRAWENLTEAEQFAILYPDRVAAGATSHHANHHHAAREGNILCNSPPPRCDPGVKQLPHPHLSRRTPAKTLCTVNAHTGRSATTIRVHQRPSARYLRSPLSTPAHHTEKPHAT